MEIIGFLRPVASIFHVNQRGSKLSAQASADSSLYDGKRVMELHAQAFPTSRDQWISGNTKMMILRDKKAS